MNKKALAVQTLVIALIFIFLVVVIFIVLSTKGSDIIINKPRTLLPWFNTNQTPVERLQLIRYEIPTDKVKWFDSLTWQELPNGEVEIEDKKLNENSLRGEIGQGYYFNPSSRERIQKALSPEITLEMIYPAGPSDIDSSTDIENDETLNEFPEKYCLTSQNIIFGQEKTGAVFGSDQTLNRGDVSIILNEQGDECLTGSENFFGRFIVKRNGKITFIPIDIGEYRKEKNLPNPSAEIEITEKQEWAQIATEVRNFALIWEESILTKPVQISYQQKTTDEKFTPKKEYFCVKKFENRFLRIDLSEPSSQTAVCQ